MANKQAKLASISMLVHGRMGTGCWLAAACSRVCWRKEVHARCRKACTGEQRPRSQSAESLLRLRLARVAARDWMEPPGPGVWYGRAPRYFTGAVVVRPCSVCCMRRSMLVVFSRCSSLDLVRSSTYLARDRTPAAALWPSLLFTYRPGDGPMVGGREMLGAHHFLRPRSVPGFQRRRAGVALAPRPAALHTVRD